MLYVNINILGLDDIRKTETYIAQFEVMNVSIAEWMLFFEEIKCYILI